MTIPIIPPPRDKIGTRPEGRRWMGMAIALGGTTAFLAIGALPLLNVAPTWVLVAMMAPFGAFTAVLLVSAIVDLWVCAFKDWREMS